MMHVVGCVFGGRRRRVDERSLKAHFQLTILSQSIVEEPCGSESQREALLDEVERTKAPASSAHTTSELEPSKFVIVRGPPRSQASVHACAKQWHDARRLAICRGSRCEQTESFASRDSSRLRSERHRLLQPCTL